MIDKNSDWGDAMIKSGKGTIQIYNLLVFVA